MGTLFAIVVVSLVAPEAASFEGDVLPILAKAGCNAAACHGAAAGRGGFGISLYGGQPAADYDAIVRQFEGRRVNLAARAESLLLRKPLGELEHGGDVRLEDGGPHARTIQAWIAAGAPRGRIRPGSCGSK